MKTVYKIAQFDEEGRLTLLAPAFEGYGQAVDYITTELIAGTYQVQKVFIKA